MKKNIIGLAALLATTTASLAAAEPLKVGAAVYGLRAEFAQIMVEAMQSHPAVTSGEVALTVFDGRYDALVQQEQFEVMITQGFDAILFFPIDVEAGAAAVASAHEAGIPVVGANARVNSDQLTAYIGSDDVEAGYIEGKYVAEKLGCKGNVVVLEGPIGISAQTQRNEGIEKALAECPDITILERQSANWSRAEAQATMENWLTAHPGQINAVIGQNDEMALGAIEAIKSAGYPTDAFVIAGIDGVTDALNAVKEGVMFTTLQDGGSQALGALDIAINAARGGGYTPQSGVWETYPGMVWADGTAGEYSVPWTPVTAGNVDALLATRQ